ncbi:hypothetical protein BTA51_22260 [Hahella sp. CCB-MM4]|uniref:substrate-binding periplasmic protein n=1 Tax=Hahella sp. (strain CCB-MM4) TaxID=1926491 RepID=UPI000B9B71CA|nr:transporter substrate-binding domain-containing protein [Hahella sp. CCB-MM4]OZG71106.1 hypothetical protein BTA51_22260 [Hahella sp. CCB-MM4]
MKIIQTLTFFCFVILTPVIQAETWNVATDRNFPPYVISEGGNVHGIHVDIVEAVMRKMGVDFNLTGYPWARVVAVTDSAGVDFSFPWVGKPERFEKYLMVGPIHTGRTVFAVRSDDNELVFESLEDLKGKKIGTVRGYAYEDRFDQADFFIRDDKASDNTSNIKKLLAGRVDLIIGDENVLSEEAKILGVRDQIKFLPKAVKVAQRYVAFPKDLTEKADRFQKALDAIVVDGSYDAILARYR